MYTLISNQAQLEPLLQRMEHEKTYYLDTEFIRTKTRYPQLGLVQLNINREIFLIDPLKMDLTIFWQKIFSAKQNVFHSCSEDVSLITHHAQRQDLYNIFDTQIALEFLGYGRSMGYQAALDEFLNIQIYKYESRSDWLARPLTDLQLDYAANDVIHLYDLAEEIKKDLGDLYAYAVQDSQCFVQELLKQRPKHELYLDLARPMHTRRELAQIQQLCSWREHLSQTKDIPLSFILKNHDLLTIIQQQPKNEQMLNHILAKDSRSRRYSHQILKNLYQLPKANEWPKRLSAPYSMTPLQQEKVHTLIQQVALDLNLNTDVVMRKKWLTELGQFMVNASDEQDLNPYLLGWRYAIITQPILKVLYND